jgi:hypothetical protein
LGALYFYNSPLFYLSKKWFLLYNIHIAKQKGNKMDLPKLTLTLRERDPNFVARFVPGNNTAVNMDEYQKDYQIEVVRYPWPNKHKKSGVEMVSRDVSIEHFYKQFEIVAK